MLSPQTELQLTTWNHSVYLKSLPSIPIAWWKLSPHPQKRLQLSCRAHTHHHVLKTQQICQISYLQLISVQASILELPSWGTFFYIYIKNPTGEYINRYSLPTPILGFPELYAILILLTSALTLTTIFPQHVLHSCLWKPLDWFYSLELFFTKSRIWDCSTVVYQLLNWWAHVTLMRVSANSRTPLKHSALNIHLHSASLVWALLQTYYLLKRTTFYQLYPTPRKALEWTLNPIKLQLIATSPIPRNGTELQMLPMNCDPMCLRSMYNLQLKKSLLCPRLRLQGIFFHRCFTKLQLQNAATWLADL